METVLKRVLTAITVMAVALLPAGRAYAEPASSDAQAEAGVEPVSATQPAPIDPGAATEGMTFEEARQAAYDILPETNSLDGWPQGPQVYGNAAIVMAIDSGAVVYGKRINDPHYPASITKLLTALVALENASLDDEVLFSQESIDILRSDYASIGMRPGEIISLNDAMYGMLLASGNEVAYAIIKAIDENQDYIRDTNAGLGDYDIIEMTATYGTALLHPGVVQYLQEKGYELDEARIPS